MNRLKRIDVGKNARRDPDHKNPDAATQYNALQQQVIDRLDTLREAIDAYHHRATHEGVDWADVGNMGNVLNDLEGTDKFVSMAMRKVTFIIDGRPAHDYVPRHRVTTASDAEQYLATMERYQHCKFHALQLQ